MPYSGGMYAQPLADMMQMEAALNVYNVYDEHRSVENSVNWEKRRPKAAALYAQIEILRGA